VVVSAGPGEGELATAVEGASGGAARRAEAPDLPRLVRLLAGAALVLGGDTGPLHLAHALDVPTLFLHGPTDPATHGPYGAPERVLCGGGSSGPPPESRSRRAGNAAGVDISEALIVERALTLAAESGRPAGASEPPPV
jgi:ADP-heptose:LPS heptosyltransferase